MKPTLYNKRPSFLLGSLLAAFALLIQSSVFGQGITSSAIKGKITDDSGAGLSGVEVTATHQPTGNKQTAETNNAGRYAFRGLPVGGPYTIVVRSIGYEAQGQGEVILELSRAFEANFELAADSTVIELEEFTVNADDDDFLFSISSAGVGTVLGEDSLLTSPKANRSFNDIARLDPRVVMTDASGGAGSISAAGQHIKMNSFQIDGVRINDQFGLGSDGSPSLANPISMDTIAEIAIEISPYDVRQSGFTGASINAVTKSGTNDFSGSLYYFFENEDMRGENPITETDDVFEESTFGFTFGGPLIKNKLFFFGSYEELERNTAGPTPGFFPNEDLLEDVIDFVKTNYSPLAGDFDPGTFGLADGATVDLNDEKYLFKVDWIINDNHRAFVRWNKTEGARPDFTEYDDFSSSQPETNLTSHWYTQNNKNESWVVQLFSNWGENWKTEFRWGRTDIDSLPTNPNVFPEIVIDDFPGTTQSGEATDRGELYFGRDDSRHSNQLFTDVTNLYLAADYFAGDHTVTFGIDHEESEFFNLFLQQTFGEMTFDDLDAFYADEILFFRRSVGVGSLDSIPASSDFATTGLFIQDDWDVSDRLNIKFGLRFDKVTTDEPILENPGNGTQTFEELFGTSNTNTIDGTDLLAPRFSFKYDLDEEGLTTLSGGVGLFLGRNPWVWISNAYSNTGLNNTDIFESPDGLLSYLTNDFDVNNPVIFVDDPSEGAATVALLAPDFELPSIWKANLNLEHKFGSESPWSTYAELLVSQAEAQIYTSQLNLNKTGTAPDGRNLYDGESGITEDYGAVFQLNSVSEGESTNFTVGIRRYMMNNWDMDLSYTYSDAEDISNQGSSTAWSNFAGNPIFNQNTPEIGTSVYETESRVLAKVGYKLNWAEGWTTRFNLVYEGKSGQNYSLLFDNDFNGDDADFDNDLFYVPTGIDDPIIDQDNSSGLEDMFAYLDSIGAARGQVAARGAFKTDWRHRVDINITQDIPMGERFQGQIYLNILNAANLVNSSAGLVDQVSFQTQPVAEGTISEDGTQIAYEFDDAPSTSVRTGTYAQLSRWRIQTGFKLKF